MRNIAIFALAFILLATTVTAQTEFQDIVVTLINHEPDPVAPGNPFIVNLRIENQGGRSASNIEVRVEPKFPFSMYGNEPDIKAIGTLEAGQVGDVGVREDFRLYVDPNAATGENPLSVWYRINRGPWAKASDFNITIRTTEATLAINQVRSEPSDIVPGTQTKVSFVLENLADNALRDIKLNLDLFSEVVTSTGLTSRELPFTPIDSGNEKTVKRIEAGQMQEVAFNLFTDANAESRVYKVPYTLTYSDNSGTNFTRQGIVGLLVASEPALSVNLDSTEVYNAGARGRVVVKLVNKGFSDIKFLDVSLTETDEFEILSNPNVYIGELDSDDYETADFDVITKSSAKDVVEMPLLVEYRDSNGQLYTINQTLNLRMYRGSDLNQRTGGGNSMFWPLVIFLVLVGAGVYLYRRFARKRK